MTDNFVWKEDFEFDKTFMDQELIPPELIRWERLIEIIAVAGKKFEESASMKRADYLVNLKWSTKKLRLSIGNNNEELERINDADVGRLKRKGPQTKQENGGKKVVLPRPPPPLPERFKDFIVENLGGTDLVLVIQKQLFFSDVNPSASRLSIPFSQLENNEFLTETEAKLLWKPKSEGIKVWLVEPSMEATEVKFDRWKMNNRECM